MVAALPLVPAIVFALLVGRLLPEPDGPGATLGWWATVLAAAALALLATDVLARRLLPLAALLQLSLLFPDHAPSRFRTALRSGSSRRLRRLIEEAAAAGVEGDPARTANTIITLVAALGAHHRPSQGHSERVRAFTDLLAEELRLPARDRHRLRWAALLHDVGKVGVPPAVLDNRGPLRRDQWETIRRHPDQGRALCAPLRPWLGPWASAIEEHHEHWDGHGYPRGLRGEEISPGGRIVCVADSFEAMTAHRTYQAPLTTEAARVRVAELSGSQFDPSVVRSFLNISVGRLRWVLGPLAVLAQVPMLGGVARAAPHLLAAGAKAGALGIAAGAVALSGGPTGLAPQPASETTGVVAPSASASAPLPPASSVEGTTGPGVAATSTTATHDTAGDSVTTGTASPPETTVTLPATLPATLPTVPLPTVNLPTVPVDE